MTKTLKGKIKIIYFLLVVITAIIGLVSVCNLYKLKSSINGLMIRNYKSINAANNMLEALESQDNSIFDFLYKDEDYGSTKFYKNSSEFYKWYNIEATNLTEDGEKKVVVYLNSEYLKYMHLFSQLQYIRDKYGVAKCLEYYNYNIIPQFSKVRKQITDISSINEKSMLKNKNIATNNVQNSMYLILILSVVGVIGGFVFSRVFINKFFEPISLLINTMKLVKEGKLNQHAPIVTQDEIGNLANEFNNMTDKIRQFEESTLGELMEEKNKSLAIVKSIQDPIIVMDNNYKILIVNKAFEKLYSVRENNIVNRHFLEIVKNGEIFDYILLVNDNKVLKQKIISINTKGMQYYFNIIVNPIKYKKTNIFNGIVVLFQNVTQLKNLDKTKAEFISSISHEFKTPLTSTMIGTSILMNEKIGKLSPRQIDIVKTIQDDSEKLTLLVDDLLKLSKLEYDKTLLRIKKSSLNIIIKNCVSEFKNQAEDKNVKFIVNYDDNIPEINIDDEKVKWVINNLISNAIKFTNKNGIININANYVKEKVYVSVKDNGIGIPKKYQKNVFDRFFQINADSRDNKGTGLGLAIAKEIIEIHGGEIWCKSEVNNGSIFTFTLPVT